MDGSLVCFIGFLCALLTVSFEGAMIRTVLGEPTGTSSKFPNMMALWLHQFELEMDVKFEKATKVVLEGEGELKRRIDKLYSTLLAHLLRTSVLFIDTLNSTTPTNDGKKPDGLPPVDLDAPPLLLARRVQRRRFGKSSSATLIHTAMGF
ncbi:hypothetical protein CVT24_006646 [Panaeolus cyanescens]|uniref:YMC020W-like alpha/beta hydrolase domain-containing protein n=1 Tax=Panaeolus cyanescens TaxID=181874 RepID=A0A409X938_9AGAR|nr:hypothetical protein CVT24_006646 [Panaeolus cyanescens]